MWLAPKADVSAVGAANCRRLIAAARQAELVTIGIGQVEEPLAPFGIARRRIWAIAGRDHSRMEGVNVGVVEDHASPPGPLALGRSRDEIEIAGSARKLVNAASSPP